MWIERETFFCLYVYPNSKKKVKLRKFTSKENMYHYFYDDDDDRHDHHQ